MDLEKIIKKLNDDFKGSYYRIRKPEEKKNNLVYYNGIKAFKINEKGIEFPINVYTCNYSSFEKYKKATETSKYDNDGEIQSYKEYKENLINMCTEMSNYYNIELDSITMESGGIYNYFNKNDEHKNQEGTIYDYLHEIKNDLQKFFKIINSNVTVENNVNDEKIEFEEFDKYEVKAKVIFNEKKKKDGRPYIKTEIEFEKINTKKDDKKSKIEKIFDIEFGYFECIKINKVNGDFEQKKTTRNSKINVSSTVIKNKNPLIEFEDFVSIVKKAIGNYKGRELVEKKYQHMFLIGGNKSNIFSNRYVIPFEEEYEIEKYGSSKDNKGRVDCIFYSINNNKLTDIYLIEVKVDSGVVDGSNGVLNHLIDIYGIQDDNDFKQTLVDRINYRHKMMNKNELNDMSDYKLHFYTIFGFRNKEEYKEIINKLKDLNNDIKIKKYIEYGDLKKCNFKIDRDYWKKFKLNPSIFELTEKCKKNVDIRFYFDKNVFNVKEWDEKCDKGEDYCSAIDFVE